MTMPGCQGNDTGHQGRRAIDAVHLPGPGDLVIIVAHGFTGSWQRPSVWRVASQLAPTAGVITFDFRVPGRSGGLSTLGRLARSGTWM